MNMNDKILHAIAGFLVAWRLFEIGVPFLVVLVAILILAVGKEKIDSLRGGKLCYFDILATVAGGLLFGLTILIEMII